MLNFGLGFMFTASDMASGVMKSVKSNFQGLEQAAGRNITGLDKMVQGLSAGLATTAAGVGGLMASLNLAKAAAGVEKGMARVHNVTGAVGADLLKFKDYALKTATAIGVMPEQALQAAEVIGQQGFKGDQAIAMLTPVLKFSKLAELSMEDAVNLPAQLMRSYNIHANQFPKILDQIVGAAKESSANVGDYTIGIARALSGASLAGADLTQTLALYGMYKDILGSVQMAGTSLSYTMQSLTDKKKRDIIATKLHIDVLDHEHGGFRNIEDVMGEMFQALTELDAVERRDIMGEIFGMEALKGMNAFVNRLGAGIEDASGKMLTGADAFKLAVKKIAAQADTVDTDFAELLKTFDEKMNVLKAKGKAVAVVIGDSFLEVWKPWIDKATDGLVTLFDKISAMDPKAKRLAATVLTGAAAFLALSGAIGLVVAAWPLIAGGAALIGDVLLGLFTSLAISAWPVTVPLLAIAAIIWAIMNNVGGLGDTWNEFTGWLTESGGVFEKVGQFFKDAWEALAWGFTKTWGYFQPVFGMLNGAIKFLADQIQGFFGEIGGGETVMGMFKWILAAIGSTVAILVEGFVELIAIAGYVVGSFIWVGKKFVQFGKWIYDHVIGPVDVATGMFKALAKLMDWTWSHPISVESKAKKIEVPSTAQPVEEKPPAVPSGPNISQIQRDIAEGALIGRHNTPTGSASAEDASYYQGVVPGSPKKDLIDYNKLAEVLASMPIYVTMDGQKLVGQLDRVVRDRNNREGR